MTPAERFDSTTEADLLARVAQRDEEALACFYDRTAGVLLGIANSIVNDAAIAEDVLQEVYLLIWEKAAVFDPRLGKPISWAIALTRHKCLDRLRSLKRRQAVLDGFEAEVNAAPAQPLPDAADSKEMAEVLQRALAQLGEKPRRAIELAFLHGLAHAEVAESMKQPLGTVKAWIRRGMIEMRNQLEEALRSRP
jgi:RNA polymerase sigma-70 factor, ECF subfamily